MNYKCFQKLAFLNTKSAHADNVLCIRRTGFSWHILKFVEILKISSNPQMNQMPYEPTEKQTHGWMDWQKTDKSFCSQNPLHMTFEEKTLKINSSFLIMGFCCACDKWQSYSIQHPLHTAHTFPSPFWWQMPTSAFRSPYTYTAITWHEQQPSALAVTMRSTKRKHNADRHQLYNQKSNCLVILPKDLSNSAKQLWN